MAASLTTRPRIVFEGDIERLRAQLDAASEPDRRSLVSGLHAKARESEQPRDWDELATACHILDWRTHAIEILEELVAGTDGYRFKLAVNLFNARQFNLSAYHFRQVCEHGSTENMRDAAREQLAVVEQAWLGDDAEREWRSRQRHALEERVVDGGAGAEDFRRLADLLLRIERIDPREATIAQAVEVLERGRARVPADLGIIEMLARCRAQYDPDGKLEPMLDALRRRAPESDVFNLVARRGQAPSYDDSSVTWAQRYLIDVIANGGPSIAGPALCDLHRLAVNQPYDLSVRAAFAAALMRCGETGRALEEARAVAGFGPEEWAIQFRLGVLFQRGNDVDRARHHARRALELASTDDERREAAQLCSTLDE
jgi:hypothetical protein